MELYRTLCAFDNEIDLIICMGQKFRLEWTDFRSTLQIRLILQENIFFSVFPPQSGNMTIVNGKSYLREETQEERTVTLNETSWFQLIKSDRYETLQPITKKEFMIILYNIERLLIRATYHSAQNSV